MTPAQDTVRNEEARLSVSQLARLADTTTSAINFYVREGLLPPPVKTSRTRALYPASFVERIARIRELNDRGLPLRVIRGLLDSDDPAAELGLGAGRARQRGPTTVTVGELLAESGLDRPDYEQLVSNRLLRAARDGSHDRRDLLAARALARLLALGVSHRLLARHNEYEPLARAEAHFLAEHITAAKDAQAGAVGPAFDAVRRYLRGRQFESEFPNLTQ